MISGLNAFNAIPGSSIWQWSENYLYVRGKRFVVSQFNSQTGEIYLASSKKKKSLFVIILKVASFATIIPPITAFIISTTYRHRYSLIYPPVQSFAEKIEILKREYKKN
ncbi:MAG: hypothetical protein ACSNEK_00675 [Parachlamydiaceae bacterium]